MHEDHGRLPRDGTHATLAIPMLGSQIAERVVALTQTDLLAEMTLRASVLNLANPDLRHGEDRLLHLVFEYGPPQ